ESVDKRSGCHDHFWCGGTCLCTVDYRRSHSRVDQGSEPAGRYTTCHRGTATCEWTVATGGGADARRSSQISARAKPGYLRAATQSPNKRHSVRQYQV